MEDRESKPWKPGARTVTDELAQLEARLRIVETQNSDMRRELIEWKQREKDIQRREEKLDAQEDDFLREKERIRARARRRERDVLEKAAHDTRLQAIRTLAAMLPAAKKQARLGKPALLRLILRSTR